VTSAARHPFGPLTFAVLAFVAAVALMVTPSADAELLGTGKASGCDTASQVFAPWGDYADYMLVPGGGFESGMPGWALSGGAKVVAGNEPFYVRSAKDKKSLYLPRGSAALSPTVCFELGDWHTRFFLRNVGSSQGSIEVDVVVKSVLGLVSILDGGSVSGSAAWAPSPRVGLTFTNLCSLLGVEAVAFRFRAVGGGAAFQVDDVYLDPWKSF
jgi:hypothetical protein